MLIEFIGDNDKIDRGRFYRAARFMLPCLLKQEQVDALRINISFLDEHRLKDCDGWTVQHDDDSNEFNIWLRPKASRKRQLTAFAHELVHVKQGVLNPGCINRPTPALSSNAEHVDDYWDDPLEIEAYGRERGLVDRFTRWESLNGKKATKTRQAS